ncbi:MULTISPECIES: 2-methylaconitate cis-trans isomerase PrpF [Sphingomonas]|jgi:probable AcnD-accessory protein PrpF|uniref:2-methylaconitate cis-trans isomerase PrpF n=1 Tax=Sphingomonas TaxID=13687 RepID=UPI000832197A|nr:MULTISPECIES: 2-methylaconitate cis-trans isomerase PrpF [Sphingomonas]MBY0302669.1 2-methylaconitate cis-trans isomerase PrpF [Sphingomonas ginsenosidimutans]
MTPQIRIRATYMRGGTSKGVFFRLEDLPERAQTPGEARDRLFRRVIGSPDPYGAHIDGMGGATSSTSKCVIVSPATRAGHDVDYLYGQIAIDSGALDWSSNCGNLSTAVGAFAIAAGYVDAAHAVDGVCTVRIWQANIGKTIVAYVPVADGRVVEAGDFALDGVAFPAAEIVLEFVDPADASDALFPTGNPVDMLTVDDAVVPGGMIPATLINAGVPTVFVAAEDLGYTGAELRDAINGDAGALARFEALRTAGAAAMGIARTTRAPAIAFVASPVDHRTSSGREVLAGEIDLLVRALSMGKLHHAMMGTASVAIAAAAAVPGTLVNEAAGGGERTSIRFGHPSGTLRVGAEAQRRGGRWIITKAVMSRSARVLMDGHVHVPADSF